MNKKILIALAVLMAACTSAFARDIRISDTPDAGTAFQIDCSTAASEGTTTVYFYDDGLNGSYSAGQGYTREITSGNSGAISVKFTQFSLATGTVLTIKDAITQTVLASNATGTELANQTFTSNRGSLQFIWTSGSQTAQGFKAKVWCGSMCQIFTTDIISNVSPTSVQNPDTHEMETFYDVCTDNSVTFTANSLFPNNDAPDGGYHQTASGLNYTWGVVYMGDTVLTNTGIGGSTFNYTFPHGGGYYVFCDAADDRGCLNRNVNTRRVRVSMQPTWPTVSFSPDTVCPGTLVNFNGAPHVEPWSYEPPAVIAGATFLPDGDGVCYNTALVFEDVFPEGATLTSVNDIERIYLNMEHSYLGDLSILLQCPNGQSCLLHAQSSSELTLVPGWSLSQVNNSNSMGGGSINLGHAPDPSTGNPCYYTAGEGFAYNFTPTATQPMGGSSYNNPNTTTISYTDPCGNTFSSVSVLNAGDYAPYERLNSLVGCPLNGEWRIYVCDHINLDNGWIFEWGLFFNPDLYLSNLWEFENTYSTATYLWNGENMNPTAGSTASAVVQNSDPNNMGQIPYTFSATDNFGCTYDTTVTVHVLASLDPSCCIQPNPTVSAGNTQPCSNSTTLSVSGYSADGNTGEWTYTSDNGGVAIFTNATSLNTTVSVNIYGNYTFTWHEYFQGNYSCTNEASVNVNFAQQMNATLVDVSSCCRSTAMINLSAPDFGTLTCTPSSAAFNAEARTFTPSAATPGQYTIRNQINGERCAVPDNSSVTFTIFDELSVELLDPVCNNDHSQVTLNFNINGVTNTAPPTYTIRCTYTENVNESGQTPDQTPHTVADSLFGRTATTYSLTADNPIEYSFRFSADNGCNTVNIPGYFDCGCPYDAGSFADYSPKIRCTGDAIQLGHNNDHERLGVLSFIVCTNTSDIYNSHVQTLPEGTSSISATDIPGFEYNRQYYVVAVEGQASGLGAWGSGCRSVTRAVPIMWKRTPQAMAYPADTCGRVIVLNGTAPEDGMRGYWTAEAGYTTIAGTDNTMHNATVLSDVDGVVNYTWHLVNAECTGDSPAVPYNFRKVPTPQAGDDRTVCGLQGLILGASATQPPIQGSSLSWSAVGVTLSPANGDQPVASANTEGTYTITLTERNGTCAGSSDMHMTFVKVPAPVTTHDVDTVCGQTAELMVYNTTPENQGRWTAYRMDGSVLDVVSYQAYGDPSLPSSDRYPHCFATVMIPDNVSEIEYEFVWSEPISDPRLPDDADCYGVDTMKVVFRKMPSVSVHVCGSTGDETTVCGRTVELCADTIASAGYATYSWVNKDIAGRFTDSLDSHTFFTVDSAMSISPFLDVPFYFIARNRTCMVIDTMNVRFLAAPKPIAGRDFAKCGRDYTLNGAWGLPPSETYSPTCTWTNLTRPQGAHAPTWPNGNNDISVPVHVNDFGIYTFEIRETNTAGDASSCYSSDTVTIEFMQEPVVNAGPDFRVCGLDFTMNAIGSHVEGEDSITGSWICQSGGNAAFDDRTDPHTSGHFSSYGEAEFWWIETNHPHIETLDPETCASHDAVTVTFFEVPSASINMNAADTIACGFTFEVLRADPSGSGIEGMWIGEPGAYASFGAGSSNITDVTVDRYGKHSFYWVEFNGPTDDQHFCKDTSDAWTVLFVEKPVAQITDTIMRFCASDGQLHVAFNGVGDGRWSASVPQSIVWFDDRNDPNTPIHTNILNSENPAYPYYMLYWHVENTDFCSDEDSIKVTFAGVPSDSIVVIPPMCFGSQAVLTAYEANLETYDWDFDISSGILDSVQTNPQGGEFRAFVHWTNREPEVHTVGITTTNSWGCRNIGTTAVEDPRRPEYHYNIIQDTCGLGKGGIEFLDTVGQFTFIWTDTSENSANITGPDQATGIIYSHHVYGLPAGSYSYRSEYQTYNTTYFSSYDLYFGTRQCIDKPMFEVGTIGMIEAEFAVSADIVLEDLVAPDAQVLFVNSTNYDNVGKKCEWHYGDGVVEKNCDELVEHIYAEPGCYEPFLIVMNRDLPECRDTAYLDLDLDRCDPGYIYVDKASSLEIPNIFSPNGDGINDYFQVHAQTLKSFKGKIINRYGRLVYEWTDWETMEAGWDGRLNGTTKATPGVYYYIIEAEGYDGMEYNPSGALHLVR